MKMYRYLISALESRFFITGIAVLGVLLRVGLICYMAAHGKTTTFKDEIDYQSLGTSLSHGGPYSIDGIHLSAFRAPAEAWLIAFIYHFFGPHIVYVKLVQALLLAIVPFACSVIGRSVGLSVAAANASAALASLHPALAFASTTLYPTALCAFALTLGLFLSVYVFNGKGGVFKSKGKGAATGAGLAFGLAASSITTFAPIGLLAALIMAAKRRYAAALIVAVLGTLPVLAWMARNKAELGVFTVSTNGEINLYLGANDLSTPMSGNNVPDSILAPYASFFEVDSERWYQVESAKWIKAHPLRWGKLVIERGILVLDSVGNPSTQGLNSGLAAHILGWVMLPVILLSLVGLGFSYRLPLAWLTLAAFLLVVASSALTITKPRFRLPCDPSLAVFSVVGFIALWKRGRDPHKDAAQVTATAIGKTA